MSTGTKPFNESPVSVKKAAFFPAIRKTLVAPGLFDPSLLGSVKPINLLKIMADDSEPRM